MSNQETEKKNRLLIPNLVASSLPAMVKNELATMTAQKQEEFIEEYKRKQKSVGTDIYYGF